MKIPHTDGDKTAVILNNRVEKLIPLKLHILMKTIQQTINRSLHSISEDLIEKKIKRIQQIN